MECWSATHLVLLPGERDISEEHAPWFVLLDHKGRMAKAAVSVLDTCDHSVCCDRCAASPEQLVDLRTTGGSHPYEFLALKVP